MQLWALYDRGSSLLLINGAPVYMANDRRLCMISSRGRRRVWCHVMACGIMWHMLSVWWGVCLWCGIMWHMLSVMWCGGYEGSTSRASGLSLRLLRRSSMTSSTWLREIERDRDRGRDREKERYWERERQRAAHSTHTLDRRHNKYNSYLQYNSLVAIVSYDYPLAHWWQYL